jgi:two-component sensor histidine kinase
MRVLARTRITQKLLTYLPGKARQWWQGVLMGVACTVVATLLRFLIDPIIVGDAFVTFFPLLVVATFLGGRWAGVTTLVLGGLIGADLWIPPYGSLDPASKEGVTAVAFMIAGSAVVLSVSLVNEVIAALRRSEARNALIAREMQHRIKNLLQLVDSISRMTARTATTVPEHQAKLSARISALAKAGEVEGASPDLPLRLDALLGRVLGPFGLSQFTLAGPPACINDDTGTTLGLVMYELATNAAKYGALSVPGGSVSVRWKPEGDFIDLEWQEMGGPAVAPPGGTGFGSTLIGAAFVAEQGATEIRYDGGGIRCSLRFPSTARAHRQADNGVDAARG